MKRFYQPDQSASDRPQNILNLPAITRLRNVPSLITGKIAMLFALICCVLSVSAQSISVTNIAFSPVCAGTSVTISFSATNGAGAANYYSNSTVYTIYLSNAAGANYTSQGTFSTTGVTYDATDGGVTAGITQSFTIPLATPAGTGYKISLGSTSPLFDGSTGTGASANINVVLTAGNPGQPGGITGNGIVCDGSTGIQYSVQPAANAASYIWTLPAGATIATGAGTRIITVNFPTPFTSGQVCVSSVNACGVVSAQRCLNVRNVATFTPGRIIGPRSVCLNSSGTVFSTDNVVGATSYNWTLPTGMTIATGAGTRTITVDVGPSLTPGPLCVSVSNACGTSLSLCINITITSGIMPGGITGPAQVCANTPGVVYSIQPITGATGYTWSVPAGYNIVSGQGTRILTVDIGPNPVTDSICVTADFLCGPSLPRCRNIIYNAPTAGIVTGQTHLCAGLTGIAYETPAQPNIISYNWTFPPGITQASGGTTNAITVDVGSDLTIGDICVTLTDVCGTSAPGCITVRDYSEVLPGGITGPNIVCPGNSGLVYSVQPVPRATSYIWVVPAGVTITAGINTNIITVDFDSSFTIGDIGVRAVADCGTESLIRWTGLVTTINPGLSGTIAAADPVCPNTTVSFAIVPLQGVAGYEWTLPAGMSVTPSTAADSNVISIDISSNFAQGVLCVKGVSACGTEGYSRCQTFSILPDRPGNISGPAGVCGGATGLEYSVADADGAVSYNWEVPPGWNITAGTGTNAITVDASANFIQGQIRVYSVSDCGINSGMRILNVHSTPAAPGLVTGSTAACDGNTYIYTVAVVPGASSYTWVLPTGMTVTPATPTDQNLISVDVDATFSGGDVCVTAATSCGGPSAASCLTVGTTPAATGEILGNVVVCAGDAGVVYTIESVPGVGTYNWTVPADITITAGQGTTTITVDVGGGFTSGQICVEGQNECGDAGTASCLDVSTTPVAADSITTSINFCPGSTRILTVSEVTGAASYTWTVPAGLTIVSGQGSANLTVEIDNAFTSGSVCVTATSPCGNDGTQYCQVIDAGAPPATPTNITSNGIVCPGLEAEFTIPNAPGTGVFTWTVPAGMTIVTGQGAPTLTAAVDPGFVSGDVCITLSSGCGASSSQFCKNFASTPATPGAISAPAFVCASDPVVIFSVAEMPGVSSYNWIVPAGITITSGQSTNAITASVDPGFTSGQVSVSAASGCGFLGATRSLNISSTPSIPGALTGPSIVCPLATGVVYSVPEINGAISYTWTIPAGFTITAGDNTNSITIDASAGFTSGTVSVAAVSECGNTGPVRAKTVSSTFGIPGLITAPAATCAGSTGLVFSVPNVPDATYEWTVPAEFTITAGDSTNSITVDIGAGFVSGQICVALVADCGIAGPQRCLNLSHLPGQPGGITGQTTGVCDLTLVYSVQPVPFAATYTWAAPAGASITNGQGTRIVEVTFTNTFTSGQLEVFTTNACGSSAVRLSAVLSGAPNTPAITSGPVSVCANQGGYSYNCSAQPGATSYDWTVPAGAVITSGNGTTHIVVTYGTNSGQVTVAASNDCGSSLIAVRNVTITCHIAGSSDMVMGMNVYPSPASEFFTVDYNSENEAKHTIELFDVNGKLVKSEVQQSVAGNNQVTFDVREFPQGMYIVKLSSSNGQHSIGRIMVQ